MKTTFVDLFSGVGGATLAARSVGCDVLFGVESDVSIGAVYVSNFQVPVFPTRVEDTSFGSVRDQVGWLHASPDFVSASRVRLKREPGIRHNSTENLSDMAASRGVVKAVSRLEPRLVTIECVENVTQYASYQRLTTTLGGLGYRVREFTVTPTQVGIPQTRNRLFLVARRDGEVKPPDLLYQTKKEADANASWTTLLRGGESEILQWELDRCYPSFSRDSEAVLRARTSGPTLFFGAGRYGRWFTAGFDKPSLTVVASQWKRKSLVIMPDGTVRKVPFYFLCRLMGFPSTFLWSGSTKLNISGLGNAVVPQVLEAVARPNLE